MLYYYALFIKMSLRVREKTLKSIYLSLLSYARQVCFRAGCVLKAALSKILF